MFDFRCSVAVAAAAIVLSLTSAESAFATTGTKFLDFTNGTTGWTTKGTTTKITATKSSNFGGKPFSLTPASGEAMIEISPSGSTTLIGTMDSVLGLSNGTVLAAVGSSAGGGSPNGTTAATYGPGDTTNYGVMVKDFTLTAGTYSFAWAYSASDYLPYTDGVFWSIAGGGVNQFNMLARNGKDFVVLGSFKEFLLELSCFKALEAFRGARKHLKLPPTAYTKSGSVRLMHSIKVYIPFYMFLG